MYKNTDDFIKKIYKNFKQRVRYADLLDKPTLFSGKYSDLSDKPNLFSGNYNDLTNKPTIPNGAGYLCHSMFFSKTNNAKSGVGYQKLLIIKGDSNSGTYNPQPIVFYGFDRNRAYIKYALSFIDSHHIGSINFFKYKKYGNINPSVYLVKESEYDWSMYGKTTAYDWFSIAGIKPYGNIYIRYDVDDFVTSLPSGYIEPTEDTSIV